MLEPRETPLQTSASDEDQLQWAKQHSDRLERELLAVDRAQLQTYDGRAFVWGELTRAHVFEDIVGTADQVYRALGRRSLGLQLLQRCMRHPELYLQMQGEALQRAKKERATREATRTKRASEVTPNK